MRRSTCARACVVRCVGGREGGAEGGLPKPAAPPAPTPPPEGSAPSARAPAPRPAPPHRTSAWYVKVSASAAAAAAQRGCSRAGRAPPRADSSSWGAALRQGHTPAVAERGSRGACGRSAAVASAREGACGEHRRRWVGVLPARRTITRPPPPHRYQHAMQHIILAPSSPAGCPRCAAPWLPCRAAGRGACTRCWVGRGQAGWVQGERGGVWAGSAAGRRLQLMARPANALAHSSPFSPPPDTRWRPLQLPCAPAPRWRAPGSWGWAPPASLAR